MHRIDHATAAPGALFTEGNPATATPATTVTDDWLNDMQENLAQLVEAASIALVKGDGTQVTDAIQALIAAAFAGVTTPPQFDNDASLATTEFVRRQGLQSSGLTVVTTSAAIGASAIGGLVVLNAAGAIAPTLPLANSVPAGAVLQLKNINTGVVTLTCSGADTIVTGEAVAPATIVIRQGDTLTLESNGTNYWYGVSGSAMPFYGRYKVGYVTRDISLTGTQDITGLGFTPSAVEILANVQGTSAASIGFSDGTANSCVLNSHAAVANSWSTAAGTGCINLMTGSGTNNVGAITIIPDGFRITWTKTGSPTGSAYIMYKAKR